MLKTLILVGLIATGAEQNPSNEACRKIHTLGQSIDLNNAHEIMQHDQACMEEIDKNTVLLKRAINNYHFLKDLFPKSDPEFAITDDPCKSLAVLMELGTPENTHEIPTIGTPCQQQILNDYQNLQDLTMKYHEITCLEKLPSQQTRTSYEN